MRLVGSLVLVLNMIDIACAGVELPPSEYSAMPIHGVVVDAETAEPLEGVFVVAQWVLYETSVGGRHSRSRLTVLETVTAADGTYAFPAWGPKSNPVTFGIPADKWYLCCFLDDRAPELLFFRAGYRPLGLLNRWDSNASVRTSEWDGKTIKLEKFVGTPEEWARQLGFLQTSLAWQQDRIDWRQIPRMILAILEECRKLPRQLLRRVGGAEALGTSEAEIRQFVEGRK